MSLDLESALRTFYASAPQTKHPVATLEISHSAITTWHLWREPYVGTAGGNAMTPANIETKLAGSPGHLDQRYDIRLGLVDAEDLFRDQMDLIPVNTLEKIVAVHREYLSDDLVNAQAEATLQVESVAWIKGAANIVAVSPRFNVTRTGEVYSPKTIPMLRGFI
jgi:hypothetical protein